MNKTLDKPVPRDRTAPPLVHLASRESGYQMALCGTPRHRPLDPSAAVSCVVCLDISKGRRA